MTHQILITQRRFSEFFKFLLTQHLLLWHHQVICWLSNFLLTQRIFRWIRSIWLTRQIFCWHNIFLLSHHHTFPESTQVTWQLTLILALNLTLTLTLMWTWPLEPTASAERDCPLRGGRGLLCKWAVNQRNEALWLAGVPVSPCYSYWLIFHNWWAVKVTFWPQFVQKRLLFNFWLKIDLAINFVNHIF